MNENQSSKALNNNEKEQRFNQVAAMLEMSGLEVDAEIKELLQPYIDGKESLEEAVARLQSMLVEAK